MPQYTNLRYGDNIDVSGKLGALPDDQRSLIVYSTPAREFNGFASFLTDENGSSSMVVDASVSGTPENVYIDQVTPSWTISGSANFVSNATTTPPPQASTEYVDATATINGDQWITTRSSAISISGYASISGYLYIDSWNASRHSVSLGVYNSGVLQGNTVNIDDYINTSSIGVWQKFIIPKDELGLSDQDIDQLIITTQTSSGNSPNYHFDTLNLEQSGGVLYKYQPAENQIFLFEQVIFSFKVSSAVTFEPNTFLGVTLANGFRIRTKISDDAVFSVGITNPAILMAAGSFPTTIEGTSDTALSMLGGIPGGGTYLVGSNEDSYSVLLQDDMTGFSDARVLIRGGLLKR